MDISSHSFEFAKELIRHNLVSSSQALRESTAVVKMVHRNSADVCWHGCSAVAWAGEDRVP